MDGGVLAENMQEFTGYIVMHGMYGGKQCAV